MNTDTDKKRSPLSVAAMQLVKNLRLAAGLTQEQLAEKIGDGVNRSVISAWENGNRPISLDRLSDIADAMGLGVKVVFYKETDVSYEGES